MLEQANEVAWEVVPSRLPLRLVQQLSNPPTIPGSRCNGDNVARLEYLGLPFRCSVLHFAILTWETWRPCQLLWVKSPPASARSHEFRT